MFEQSLMESAGVARSHRGLTTSLSALAQLALLGIAVLLPMFFTQTMPLLKSHPIEPVMMPRAVPPPEPPPPNEQRSGQNNLAIGPRTIVVNPFPAIRPFGEEHTVADPQIPQTYTVGPTSPRDLPLGPHSTLPGGPKAP